MSANVEGMDILTIDVGGTHVKVLRSGKRTPHKADSGPGRTPARLVTLVRKLAEGWPYDAVSIGYPGLVVQGKIAAEPNNLGRGWVRFDFERALGKPVKVLNDAAMQALGSYEGGRMLFLGLGTGLGSAVIADGRLEPMELGHLPYKKGKSYEDYVGARGYERYGKRKWRKHVLEAIELLRAALEPEYVVVGGGNARKLIDLPPGVRLGENANAFTGGFRLWRHEGAAKGGKRRGRGPAARADARPT